MAKSIKPSSQNASDSRRPGFRVIAYVTNSAVASVIPYDKLTHINFAFLLPNEDGSFQELLNTW